jgi:hypothetical protein
MAVARVGGLLLLAAALVFAAGCDNNVDRRNRPDMTKGVVTGVVICTDTGKPARFATVALTAIPKTVEQAKADPLSPVETVLTDIEGRFRIEAVEPGRYYAFALLGGYLDPAAGINFARLEGLANDKERNMDAIEQWKDHLAAVTVKAHHSVEVSLTVERAAEIAGTVTWEDGAPAIGMHFKLERKVDEKTWSEVGMMMLDNFSLRTMSDGRGRYRIANLPAGEYKVCALMPAYTEDTASSWCMGDTYRIKNAEAIKVRAGEATNDADIEIPISGLHTISGIVTAAGDGHVLTAGTVKLLYADDRETAREIKVYPDGGFIFEYVPEDGFILQVSGVDETAAVSDDSSAGSGERKTPGTRRYADREIRLDVQDDVTDMKVGMVVAPQAPMPTPPPAAQTH